ncbi:MAG: hypothetical protein J5956_11405 [Ruminococcus sp.]|nr:hypothetical protein [Ruminococcus sp.]
MTYNEWLIYKLDDYTYHKYDIVIIETDNPTLFTGRLNAYYGIDSYDCDLSLLVDLSKKTVVLDDWFNIDKESPTYQKNIVSWYNNENKRPVTVPSMELDDWKAAIDKIMTEVVDNPEIKNHLVSQFS